MLFALVQLCSGLGLAADLHEFPLMAYYGDTVAEFVSKFVKVSALFAPTEGLHF